MRRTVGVLALAACAWAEVAHPPHLRNMFMGTFNATFGFKAQYQVRAAGAGSAPRRGSE